MRSWERDAWAASEPVQCPDCGAVGDLCWVRNNDLCPHAKVRAHKAPEGVTPAPYAVLPGGGRIYREEGNQ